jgi:hypothetical protein
MLPPSQRFSLIYNDARLGVCSRKKKFILPFNPRQQNKSLWWVLFLLFYFIKSHDHVFIVEHKFPKLQWKETLMLWCSALYLTHDFRSRLRISCWTLRQDYVERLAFFNSTNFLQTTLPSIDFDQTKKVSAQTRKGNCTEVACLCHGLEPNN